MYVFICIYHILCMYLSYSMYVYIIISSNTLIRPITDINTLTDNCFACSLLCNFWLLANDKMGDPWPYPIAGSPSILWGASEALHLKAGWRIAGWRGIAQRHVLSAIKGCGGYAIYATWEDWGPTAWCAFMVKFFQGTSVRFVKCNQFGKVDQNN